MFMLHGWYPLNIKLRENVNVTCVVVDTALLQAIKTHININMTAKCSALVMINYLPILYICRSNRSATETVRCVTSGADANV